MRSWARGCHAFELESYGGSRCANVDRPEGLFGTGLVPDTLDVDATLRKVLDEGLPPRLSGARSMAIGGVPHGLPTGRGTTVFVVEDACVPAGPMATPAELDLRGYPVHAPDGVVVAFLLGTLLAGQRDRLLATVRVND
ncbi:hypothetical protein [Amycolatopsis sp. CA-128772]|uniref:hypothetical protein n=1 Tax=Amycolatopsis sp. CA-128772 TaxID=2073159 RepID=UPI000CD19043|nr:hypothetical protein [Amycolatopsis sp. CA-128772]